MPVPPLPNELITLIFEHLYRLLRAVPEKEFLDVPLDAHSTFFPLLVVSRTWRRLARPFFYRHLSSDNMRKADRTWRFWRRNNLSRVKSFELAVNRLHWIEEWRDDASSLAAGLECLLVRGTATSLSGSLFPQPFAALRSFRFSGTRDALRGREALDALSALAEGSPLLEDVHLAVTFVPPNATSTTSWKHPPYRFRRLRRLAIDARLGTPSTLLDYLIPAFVEASASTLTHLSFRIAIVPRAGVSPIPYAALLPFPLPELLSLHLSSVADVQEATFSRSPQLRVLSITGNHNGANATLPSLPPSLRHLVIQFSYADDALPFLRDLLQVSLAHLSTLGFELPDRREELYREDAKVLEAHTVPLLQRCRELGVNFHSDFLHWNLPRDAFEIPPLAASHDLVVRARARPMEGSAADGCEGEESESEDDGEPAEPEDELGRDSEYFANGSYRKPGRDEDENSECGELVHDDAIASGGSPAMSADEYEDDWDAEDGELARARWSERRRMDFAFEQAYPDPLAHFPSVEAFEAAKQAAGEAMRPFLHGDMDGRDGE
ncbi:hypothetical protein JCM10213_003301 [Rhodosporidiobolus nylandii]